MNLLSNAIKFTEHGGVGMKISVDSATMQEVWLRFAISDTGIGVGTADQERIFAPFTQVDSSSTRRHGGTGLGLAIVAELVRVMGGHVSIESELGRGSTFAVVVPLAYAMLSKPGGTPRRTTGSAKTETPPEITGIAGRCPRGAAPRAGC